MKKEPARGRLTIGSHRDTWGKSVTGKMRQARESLQLPGRGEPLAYTALISTSELAAQLTEPDWRVADCRFELGKPDAGRAAWFAGHIEGALHADLERDLSAPVTPLTGRHPLPSIETMTAVFSRYGIGAGTQVVCYDAGNGAYASRLWWMLRYLGHEAVAVLDGGFSAWVAEGRPVSTRASSHPPARFAPRPRPQMLCDAAGVIRALAGGELLVDVRGVERFAGVVEPLDAIAGHVPGAINLPFLANLDALILMC
jgi:thiosulfate/3-mercaptopyruvate sulfurtransferase